MNIFGQGWNPWGNWESQGSKAAPDALRTQGTNNQVAVEVTEGVSLSDLRVGQTFFGQIQDITAQDVTILLENQQLLHARLGEGMELAIGQAMLFEVKDKQDGQLYIRPAESGVMPDENPAAQKALAANGFSPSSRNLQIAGALMEAGMPLDKETMRTIMQQSVRFPEADIRQLVAMNRLQLPVTEANIRQFAQYEAHEHQLSDAIMQTTDALLKTADMLSQTENGAGIREFHQQVMDSFGWNSEPKAVSAELTEGNPLDKAGLSGKNTELPAILQEQLQRQEIPKDVIERLVSNKATVGEQLAEITNYIQGEFAPEVLHTFLRSPAYREMLHDAVREAWSLQPEKMKEPEEVNRLYERIEHQSRHLETALQNLNLSDGKFSGQSQNMRENLQFIQQLNQQFIYAQVPLKLHQQEANSELYVYANKKKLQQNADGVKVLLHLDMPHLGNTDILVRLKGQKLHASFTMEDQTTVTLVAEHMEELKEKLENKGFLYQSDVTKREQTETAEASGSQPDAVVEEMFGQDLVTGQKRYTFDMRT